MQGFAGGRMIALFVGEVCFRFDLAFGEVASLCGCFVTGPANSGAFSFTAIRSSSSVKKQLTACNPTDYDEGITEKGGGPV